ncbi:hypothetical protein Bbelb_379300 [Branchiostoma belcheri]|nr:hypothetical protein Bbelb_379300 [Branchiostoma belcheri]
MEIMGGQVGVNHVSSSTQFNTVYTASTMSTGESTELFGRRPDPRAHRHAAVTVGGTREGCQGDVKGQGMNDILEGGSIIPHVLWNHLFQNICKPRLPTQQGHQSYRRCHLNVNWN